MINRLTITSHKKMAKDSGFVFGENFSDPVHRGSLFCYQTLLIIQDVSKIDGNDHFFLDLTADTISRKVVPSR